MKTPIDLMFVKCEFKRMSRDGRIQLFAVILCAASLLLAGTGVVRYKSIQARIQEIEQGFQEGLRERSSNLTRVVLSRWNMVNPVNSMILFAGGRTLDLPRHVQTINPMAINTSLDDWNSRFPNKITSINLDTTRLVDFDVSFVVGVLLPLILILMCYGTICQERREGILRLVLSGPIARVRFLLGRVLAYALLGWMMLLLCLIIFYCVGLVSGLNMHLDWKMILPAVLVSVFYLLFWIVLILLVSTKAKSPQQSLVILLSVWLFAGFVWPSCIAFFVSTEKIPTRFETGKRIEEIISSGYGIAYKQGGYYRGGNFPLTEADNHRHERILSEMMESIIKPGVKMHNDAMLNEVILLVKADRIGCLSPYLLYRSLMEEIVGSGVSTFRRFVQSIYPYFTKLDMFLKESDARDPESVHLMYLQGYMSNKPIAYETIPQWSMPQRSLDSDPWMSRKLLLMSGIVFSTIAACVYAFVRQDV